MKTLTFIVLIIIIFCPVSIAFVPNDIKKDDNRFLLSQDNDLSDFLEDYEPLVNQASFYVIGGEYNKALAIYNSILKSYSVDELCITPKFMPRHIPSKIFRDLSQIYKTQQKYKLARFYLLKSAQCLLQDEKFYDGEIMQDSIKQQNQIQLNLVQAEANQLSQLASIFDNGEAKDESYYLKTGDYYLQQKQLEGAIYSFKKAIEINPQRSETYYRLLEIYLSLAKYQESIEILSLLIQKNPSSSIGAYYYRGIAYQKNGQYSNAKSDFLKAYTLINKNQDPQGYLKIQGALQNIEIAIKQESDRKKRAAAPIINPTVKKQLMRHACQMNEQGYTRGEIIERLIYLVEINASEGNQQSSYSSGTSVGSQASNIFTNLFNNLSNIKYEETAIDIVNTAAKKKCKI